MFKKVSSMVLAIVMLLSMTCSFAVVSAAGSDVNLTVDFDVDQATWGDTVVATVALTDHNAFGSLELDGGFDTSVLTYVSHEVKDLGREVQAVVDHGVIALSWSGSTNVDAAEETVLATFTFKVKDGITASTLENPVFGTVALAVTDAAANDEDSLDPIQLTFDANEVVGAVKVVCHHTFTGAVTNNKDGSHTGTCVTCGAVTDTCNYKVTKVPASHTEAAHDLLTCVECGYSMKVNHTGDPEPHTAWKSNGNGTHTSNCCSAVAIESCTYAPTTSCMKVCTACGYATANAGGKHTLSEHYYAPTPTKAGKIQMECEVEGCGYVTDKIDLNAGHPFPDVKKPGNWYYTEVLFAEAYGIFQGGTDGTFKPTSKITKGEVVAVLSRALLAEVGITEDEMKSAKDFDAFLATVLVRAGLDAGDVSDVKLTDVKGKWYERNARLMAYFGVVTGTDTGAFKGGSNVTRQELAAMFNRYVALMEKINGETYNNFGTPVAAYTDAAKIPGWAKKYVEWARSTGLMQGDANGNFNPTNTATRAEIAIMIMRVYVEVNNITTHIPEGDI